MNIGIELETNPVFELSGRHKLCNLTKVDIGVNGVLIEPEELNFSDEIDTRVFVSNEKIIANDNGFKDGNDKIFIATISLGECISELNDLLINFANCYVKYLNIKEIHHLQYARMDFDLKKYKKIKLKGNFYNLDLSKVNKVDFKDGVIEKPKYRNNAKLKRRLIKWLKTCGITKSDVVDINEMKLIKMETLLHIFDLCLYVYNLYLKIVNSENDFKINFSINYQAKLNKDGYFVVEKRVTDLLNAIYIMLISYYKGDFRKIKQCEFCNNFFLTTRSHTKTCKKECRYAKSYNLQKNN